MAIKKSSPKPKSAQPTRVAKAKVKVTPTAGKPKVEAHARIVAPKPSSDRAHVAAALALRSGDIQRTAESGLRLVSNAAPRFENTDYCDLSVVTRTVGPSGRPELARFIAGACGGGPDVCVMADDFKAFLQALDPSLYRSLGDVARRTDSAAHAADHFLKEANERLVTVWETLDGECRAKFGDGYSVMLAVSRQRGPELRIGFHASAPKA